MWAERADKKLYTNPFSCKVSLEWVKLSLLGTSRERNIQHLCLFYCPSSLSYFSVKNFSHFFASTKMLHFIKEIVSWTSLILLGPFQDRIFYDSVIYMNKLNFFNHHICFVQLCQGLAEINRIMFHSIKTWIVLALCLLPIISGWSCCLVRLFCYYFLIWVHDTWFHFCSNSDVLMKRQHHWQFLLHAQNFLLLKVYRSAVCFW